MYKVCIWISLVFCILVLPFNAQAGGKIDSFHMEICINSDGSATITEYWNIDVSDGTEIYKPMRKESHSEWTNLSVWDEQFGYYQVRDPWDTNLSFDQKAGTCGFNYTGNDIEICWGIGKYSSSRKYTITYTITNYIRQLEDSQALYWWLVPEGLGDSLWKFTASIYTDNGIPFDDNNSRLWSFGYEGIIEYRGGAIWLENDQPLKATEYVVALVGFDPNAFGITCGYSENRTLEDLHNEATRDETMAQSSAAGSPAAIITGFTLFAFLLPNAIFLLSYIHWVKEQRKLGVRTFTTTKISNSAKPEIVVQYWRDIPCGEHLDYAFWVLSEYKIVTTETLRAGLIGAIILKWISQGKVQVIPADKPAGAVYSEEQFVSFVLAPSWTPSLPFEAELFAMLKKAAGPEMILHPFEISLWCSEHAAEIELWFKQTKNRVRDNLVSSGAVVRKVQIEPQNVFHRFLRYQLQTNTYTIGAEVKVEADRLNGLRKYLQDFTRIKERRPIEVHLWQQYLVFAQLLGIADTVQTQFENLYPQYEQQLFRTSLGSSGRVSISGATSGFSKAVTRTVSNASAFSSGSSGRSSSSGGRSGSGGSRGGGSR